MKVCLGCDKNLSNASFLGGRCYCRYCERRNKTKEKETTCKRCGKITAPDTILRNLGCIFCLPQDEFGVRGVSYTEMREFWGHVKALGYTVNRDGRTFKNTVTHDSISCESDCDIKAIEGMHLVKEDSDNYYLSDKPSASYWDSGLVKLKKPYSRRGKKVRRSILDSKRVYLGDLYNIIACTDCGIIINKKDSVSAYDYGYEQRGGKIGPLTRHCHGYCKSCAKERDEVVLDTYTKDRKRNVERRKGMGEIRRKINAEKRAEEMFFASLAMGNNSK